MPQQEYEIITGIVIATLVFLILGFFISILVAFINQRKKKHAEEKQKMQSDFQQEMLKAQLEIQEETFNNISQEIHDNVGQILSLAKVQLNIMNESKTMTDEMLISVKENVGKAISDLRDISKSLSSERLRFVSIRSSVLNEAERVNKSGVGTIKISIEGEERELAEQKKLILFRIIQESLQNSIKHASAPQINICLSYQPAALMTTIADNGKGFDMEEALQKRAGLGLMNIKSRTALAGGNSVIESELNVGTIIKISMPYE